MNLISFSRLDDEGYTGSIRNGVMKFSKGSLIVARARKVNTLYLMNARLCPEEVNVTSDTAGELWHKRLCHMRVFRSRDIIFMEDKTLTDWESEKKIMSSDEIRTHPVKSG